MMTKVKNVLGLKKVPFSKEIAAKELFETASLKEACARFEAALENEDAALITGAAGTGKSCVLRKFVSSLDDKLYKVIYLSGEQSRPGDIAKTVLAKMNMSVPFHGTRALRELKEAVVALNTNKGQKPVLVIDEAQELPVPTLISLKTLLNYDMDSRNFLLLILSGQPEFENTLRLQSLESLARRIRIRYQALPLELEECSRYIRHQTRLAGLERQLFADEAVARVFEFSRGVIAYVNSICFEALLFAASESREIINPSDVERVAKTF